MPIVLDASALLAIVFEERGADVAVAAIESGLVSAVNMVEVIEKSVRRGIDAWEAEIGLIRLGLEVVEFSLAEAKIAAELKARPRFKDVSLGDRSCLAAALHRNLPIITGDRAWAGLDLGIDIRLIR